MNEAPIYVGLTTLPSRIGRIRDTIESLLVQTVVPDKIFLSLPERSIREGCGYEVPEWLANDAFSRVEIVHCSQDYGPGTKLLGCLPRIAHPACLIVVDDDLKYSPFVVERLSSAQLSQRDASFSFFVYRDGPFSVGQGADGFSFYTSNLVGIDSFAAVALQNRALFVADDLWVSVFLKNKGVRVRSLRYQLAPGEVVYEQTFDRPNQLRHLEGELQRHTAHSKGARYLVKSGVLGCRVQVAYWMWQIPGFAFCEMSLRRIVGGLFRWIRTLFGPDRTR